MRIIEQTSERLKTRHHPMTTWLVGIFCNGIALYTFFQMLVFEPISTVLTCTRQSAQVDCQLQQKTIVGIQRQQNLQAVQSVNESEHSA
jgi:hypothetical protein